MTPKEKAQDLVNTFKYYVHGYIGSSMLTNYEYPDQILSQAKKVANIVVDEIIFEIKHNIHLDWMPTRKTGEDFVEYWTQVKEEIENTTIDQ